MAETHDIRPGKWEHTDSTGDKARLNLSEHGAGWWFNAGNLVVLTPTDVVDLRDFLNDHVQ